MTKCQLCLHFHIKVQPCLLLVKQKCQLKLKSTNFNQYYHAIHPSINLISYRPFGSCRSQMVLCAAVFGKPSHHIIISCVHWELWVGQCWLL